MTEYDLHEIRTVAPGLTRETFWWGRIWKGTAEALIGAGVIQRDWLPDGVERDKRGRVVRSKKIERAGRALIVRQTSRLAYKVAEHYSETEQLERKKRRELEKELRDQAELLESLPSSHRQFREKIAAYISKYLAVQLQGIAQQFAGYRYSPQALAEIAEARDELLRCLMEGETLFSPRARAKEIIEIRAKAAAADPGLQDFLERVQTSGRGAAA